MRAGWSRLCALAVQLSKAHGPCEWYRLWRETQFVVAGLVVEDALDRERRHILQSCLGLRRRVDQHVLHDAKRPLIDLHVLVQRLEMIVLGGWVLSASSQESSLWLYRESE